MANDIFRCYGLHKIHDSMTEDYDTKDNDASQWELVKVKSVMDSDGFMTDYAWYTNEDKDKHIFMFGDTDFTAPDEDYADWVAETESEANEWFNSYTGFAEEEDDWNNFEYDNVDEEFTGNANFLNDGFERVFGQGAELED